jgi:hypothetical protein
VALKIEYKSLKALNVVSVASGVGYDDLVFTTGARW